MSEKPRPLDMERVIAGLTSLPVGLPIRYLPAADSTNRVARDLCLPYGASVITDYQSAGRGRRGRAWQVPANSSLLLSVVLRPPAGVALADITVIAPLAVADAVMDETGLATTLKWPNDVLVDERKLCGILTEHDARTDRVVVGAGLNVNFVPDRSDPLTSNATSVQAELGAAHDREALLVALFTRLNMWYRMLTDHADAVHRAWVTRLAVAGRHLEVHDNTGTWEAVAIAVQRDGALVVRDHRGEIRPLYAADVSIRGAGSKPAGLREES